jgi:hypothetical protein
MVVRFRLVVTTSLEDEPAQEQMLQEQWTLWSENKVP